MTTRDARRLATQRYVRDIRARKAKRREKAPPPIVEVPDDPIPWIQENIRWPHEDNPSIPAGELNELNLDYLRRRTAFRFENGRKIPGLDIVAKPRKIHMTTGCALSLGIWASIKIPGAEGYVYLQSSKVIPATFRKVKFALKHLPPGLPHMVGQQKNDQIELSNGSVIYFVTAGQTEDVADRQARSGTAAWVVMSEWGSFQYPELAWASAKHACPPGHEWVIVEGTPPKHMPNWGVDEYERTTQGRGSFTGAFFWPWYKDAKRQIPPENPIHEVMLSKEVEATIDPHDLEAERKLNLTPSQIAWRRQNYCMGTLATRKQNRRELPESVAMATATGHDRYLDLDCLEAMKASICPPRARLDISPSWWAAVWPGAPRCVMITSDSAERWGRDRSCLIAIDIESHDLVGVAHGHAHPEEVLQALEWLLKMLNCQAHDRHWYALERMHDVGLSRLAMDKSRGLHLWYARRRHQDGTWGLDAMPGYVLTQTTRPELINHLTSWAAGGGLGPRCEVRCQELYDELDALTDIKGKVQAAPNHHDDLAMAWGGAHWIADRVQARVQEKAGASTIRSAPMQKITRAW